MTEASTSYLIVLLLVLLGFFAIASAGVCLIIKILRSFFKNPNKPYENK